MSASVVALCENVIIMSGAGLDVRKLSSELNNIFGVVDFHIQVSYGARCTWILY